MFGMDMLEARVIRTFFLPHGTSPFINKPCWFLGIRRNVRARYRSSDFKGNRAFFDMEFYPMVTVGQIQVIQGSTFG